MQYFQYADNIQFYIVSPSHCIWLVQLRTYSAFNRDYGMNGLKLNLNKTEVMLVDWRKQSAGLFYFSSRYWRSGTVNSDAGFHPRNFVGTSAASECQSISSDQDFAFHVSFA